MTHTVFHRGYGIELNLTEADLGHPERPGLLDEVYRDYKPDLLYCLDAHEHGDGRCPGFMTIRKLNGRPHAMHVHTGERTETHNESDLHKALKEYTAATADREGFAVSVPSRCTPAIVLGFAAVDTVLLKRIYVLVFTEHGTRRLRLGWRRREPDRDVGDPAGPHTTPESRDGAG